jgi:micrococcal nuclease
VIRVVDGDTFEADVAGVSTTIRLLNVDTSETKDPDEAVQCLGPEATAFLRERLPLGSTVSLGYDTVRLDRYGRTLAGVTTADGTLVNAEIARAGLGVPVEFDGNVRYLDAVEDAWDEAASARAGAARPGSGLHDPMPGRGRGGSPRRVARSDECREFLR